MSRITCLVLSPAQLSLLASPFRHQLLTTFQKLGPTSVNAVAEAIERPPKSTYYQVRKLEEAQLIELVGYQGEGRNREALYDAVADTYDNPKGSNVSDLRRETNRAARATLRRAERDQERANGFLEFDDSRRAGLFVFSGEAKLLPEEIDQVRTMIEEVHQFLRDHHQTTNPITLSITSIGAPVRL